MSWSKPVAPGFISRYDPIAKSTSGSAAESVGMWLLEQLREKYPKHRDEGGLVDITYEWFFSLEPKTAISLPAVAIGVMTAEYPKLGSALHAGEGAIVPGELKDAEILLVVLANNVKLRDGIEDRLSRWINKIINHGVDIPLRFATKYDPGDDRGFTQIDRFVISSLWQNLTDEAFVKVSMFRTGYVEDYVEPEDGLGSIWNGIVGSANVSGGVTARVSGLGHRSLSVLFTPTMPWDGTTEGNGQNSHLSQCRIVKADDIQVTSNTTIV
jgi:hypothetical protein